MNKKIVIILLILFVSLAGITTINASTIKVTDTINIMAITNKGFGESGQTCIEVVGGNLSKLIKLSINVLRIAGATIAIVKGMMLLIPPIMSGDAKELKTSEKRCVKLAIALLLIGVFPTIINFIAFLFKYDVSCIFNI